MLTHPHQRKRAQKKELEPYPASTLSLRMLDKAVFVIGVLGPLMTLPQVIKIYAFHDAGGVSTLTWGPYAILDLPWILYGIVHKEKAITVSYCLWFLFNSSVFIGAVIYGTNPL